MEGRLTAMLISLVVFGSLIVGYYSFVSDLSNENSYNVEIIDQSATFDETENLNKKLNESYTSLAKTRTSLLAQFFTGVAAGFNILMTLITSPFRIAGSFLTDMGRLLLLPPWVMQLGTGLILIIVVVAGLAWIRREP